MSVNVTFVTSFAEDMFEATGRSLLDSYVAISPPKSYRMFVCHEHKEAGSGLAEQLKAWPVETLDITNDSLLTSWLKASRDVIPIHLGGLCQPCHCPERDKMHGRHKKGCPGQWINRNASRWFRKIVSWKRGAEFAKKQSSKPGYMVWVDSDVQLFGSADVPRILSGWLDHQLAPYDAMICRGKRLMTESGVIGYNLNKRGGALIDAVLRTYTSQAYRQLEFWADNAVLDATIKKRGFSVCDLVDKKSQVGNDVVPQTPWAKVLVHKKGTHSRQFGVMV